MALLSLMRRKDSFGYMTQIFASNVFILILNTLTGVIIARHLGPEGRGEQAAMIMWTQLLSFMVTLGLPSSIVYLMKKKEEIEGSLYIAALWMCVFLGGLAVTVGLVFIPLWMDGYSSDTINFARWALILVPFGLMGVVNNAVLQARDEYKLFNRIRYLPNVITLVLLYGLVVTGSVNPFYTALAYIIPTIPMTMWITVRQLSIYKLKQTGLLQSARKLSGYGIRSYGTDLAGTLSFYMDQVLVVGLLSPASLGIYLVALNLSKMLDIVQSSVVSVLFPQAASLQQIDAIELTLKVYRISSAITLCLGVMVIGTAPFALLLLYGNQFEAAIPVFRILIIQVAISSAAWTLAQGIMAIGKPGRVTLLKVLSLFMNVILINLLIPHMGIIGAAVALLISSIINFVIIIILYVMEYKVAWMAFLFNKQDLLWLLEKWNVRKSRRVNHTT